MDECLCHSIRQLAKHHDESRAEAIFSALNNHLRDLRDIICRSKALKRDVQYRITPSNQRTVKALLVDSVNLTLADRVCARFEHDLDGFWAAGGDAVNVDLRRRLACVVVFLRSKLDPEASVPLQVARVFQGQHNYSDIRNSGRKYIKIARKLSGLGALLWLPVSVPPST